MSDLYAADAVKLREMISGYMISQVISVTARLGLADLLANGVTSAEALARASETHGQSLARLLRALAALGLVEEPEPGCFKLSSLGAWLRTDVPGSLRNLALMLGGEATWRAWADLLHTICTGETAFEHVFGMGSFQHSARDPARAAVFDAYMADLTRRSIAAILAAHDFSGYRRIVDVGGGNGALLSGILAAVPGAEGCVFDTPSGLRGVKPRLEEAGVAERCRVEAGDFFEAVPAGGDAYILKSILHDWDDDRAVAILKNCRRAMHPDGTLLVLERALPERIERSDAHREMAMMDMHMLVATGGQERSACRYVALFAAAGLTATAARATSSPFTILTARRSKGRGVQDHGGER
jgi:O-methyltransferase domain/Dimerisation domain